MRLRGQHGYAMVTLLITLSIMGILLTVVMPVWKQMARREQETELVFRGQQYMHAIGLFQRRFGPGVYPPSVDALVDQHFLRKKFKDPITGDDFVPLAELSFDLVIPAAHLEHRAIEIMLDVLQEARTRRQLDTLPGYDASDAGVIRQRFDAA